MGNGGPGRGSDFLREALCRGGSAEFLPKECFGRYFAGVAWQSFCLRSALVAHEVTLVPAVTIFSRKSVGVGIIVRSMIKLWFTGVLCRS